MGLPDSDQRIDESTLDSAGANAAEACEKGVGKNVVGFGQDGLDVFPLLVLERDVDGICGALSMYPWWVGRQTVAEAVSHTAFGTDRGHFGTVGSTGRMES